MIKIPKIIILFIGFCLLFVIPNIFAASEPLPTIGNVADTLTAGTNILTKFLHFVCIVVGIGMFGVAISMYKNHRMNPKFVPLDRPIMYLIFGIILISIPFLGEIFGITQHLDYANKQKSKKTVEIQDIDAPLNWGNDYNH